MLSVADGALALVPVEMCMCPDVPLSCGIGCIVPPVLVMVKLGAAG